VFVNKFQRIKPISISLSPNTERDDILLALKLLFSPWSWKRGPAVQKLEKEFKKYLGVKYSFAFNSGRSAFLAILNSLNLPKKSEVLLQAFTCNASVNPIIWAGFSPVFVDCNEKTFNIDIDDLKRKISQKSKIIVVQHTFGTPAEIEKVLAIMRQELKEGKKLILIEDCAHSLGAHYTTSSGSKKMVGTFGKASFFSFSRDKIISSIYGGLVVTNDDKLAEKIREFQKKIKYPSYFWIFQQLLHPLLMNWIILPTYSIFGKYLLVVLQYLRLLSKAVHQKEKKGKMPNYFPKKMPNALAVLALNQFRKIEKFNKHREKIAQLYFQKLKKSSFGLPENRGVFLRFTLKNPNAHQIIKKAWKKNLLIGDWYTSPIAPDDTKLEKINYKIGSCPKAEKLAKTTFNLPTHINISEKKAEKIVEFLLKLKI